MSGSEYASFLAALAEPLRVAASGEEAALRAALTAAIDAGAVAWPSPRRAGRVGAALAQRLAGEPRGARGRVGDARPRRAVAGPRVCPRGAARRWPASMRAASRTSTPRRAAGVPDGQVARPSSRAAQVLAGSEGPPRLASYAGRGDLRGFVRVGRGARGHRLAARDGAPRGARVRSTMSSRATVGEDPELLLIKGRIGRAARGLHAEALAQLEDRDRTLLRLSRSRA